VIQRMGQWIDAVRAHEIGQPDVYAAIVASWAHADLVEIFPYLEALIELVKAPTRLDVLQPSPSPRLARPGPPGRRAPHLSEFEVEQVRTLASLSWVQADPNRLLKLGAVLHSDIARLAKVDPAVFTPPIAGRATVAQIGRSAGERVVVRAPDAEFRGMEYGVVHWDLARMLLDQVAPIPSNDTFVRQWYRATAAYLSGEGFFGEAKPHFVRASKLFPSDANLLFSHGCMQAAMAAPGVQDFVQATRLPGGLRIDIQSAGEHLGNAGDLFERALAIDPQLVEARVRLARVIAERGRHQEALKMLRQAAPLATDPVVAYFAQMFMGDAARALSDVEAAKTAYQHAADLFPRAQTPRLALSHLERRAGNTAAALAALEPLFTLSDDLPSRRDPWWDYHRGEGRYTDALYADLNRLITPQP
jgi:tetratricopeptide (TPR) repeat protein